MEQIRQWAIGLCAGVLFITLISFLVPKGHMEKLLRVILSVFLILLMVTPFLSGEKIKFSVDLSQKQTSKSYAQAEKEIQDQLLEQAQRQMIQKLDEILEPLEAEGETRLQMEWGENQEILITELNIVVPDEQAANRRQIQEAIKQKLGVIATISLASEE